MSGRYLLDTNCVIALFADDSALKDRLAGADEVFVPSIALGELHYGARKSRRVAENVARIDDFAVQNAVLGCTADTARHYGQIKDELRQKGSPIPENDIWIAAIARQERLILLARDVHFDEVEGLRVQTW